MDFPELDFSKFNEADVREEIVAPLLRKLGYRSGSENNVIREQVLRYPSKYIGRKKPKDPPLRGKPDYICEVDGRIRWIIEAKDPNSNLDIEEIDQAFSYAFHPEVRAFYFVLCNGRKLQVFLIDSNPESKPIFEIEYRDFLNHFDKISNVLSPTALKRDYKKEQLDFSKPLASGLRSFARLSNGQINYDYNSAHISALSEFTIIISGGSIERSDEGKMMALVEVFSPFRRIQELLEKLGIGSIELQSEVDCISEDEGSLTNFIGSKTVSIPEGEVLLDISSMKLVALPRSISFKVTTKIAGYFKDGKINGIIEVESIYFESKDRINFSGRFSVAVT